MTLSPLLHVTCVGMETTPGNPCRCCCDNCIDERCQEHLPSHDNCPKPKRYWWCERDAWEWDRWKFVYFGGDEFCNRTIVLRLWKPFVFVRNWHLRSESCDECLSLIFGEEKE